MSYYKLYKLLDDLLDEIPFLDRSIQSIQDQCFTARGWIRHRIIQLHEQEVELCKLEEALQAKEQERAAQEMFKMHALNERDEAREQLAQARQQALKEAVEECAKIAERHEATELEHRKYGNELRGASACQEVANLIRSLTPPPAKVKEQI